MASIRRTLSPAHRHASLLPTITAAGFSNTSPSRKRKWAYHQQHQHQRLIFFVLPRSFLLFFLAGVFLGLFALLHDLLLLASNTSIPSTFHHPPPPSAQLFHGSKLVREENTTSNNNNNNNNNKLLIVVTPTYERALQAYYLTRLAQTLRLVPPPLLWVVVESSDNASPETPQLLHSTGLTYRHLLSPADGADKNIKDRGVHQRNAALAHIELHRLDGIIYFADDDNIYTLELFHHIRSIQRFGTWPIAFLSQGKSKAVLEGPACNRNRVIGWHTNEKSKRLRRFHVDMSGFAFNSTLLWDPNRWNRKNPNKIRQLDTVKEGFQETTFIEQLVEDESQMEGIPDGCSKIMNWHLHVEAKNIVYPKGWRLEKNLDVILPLS